MRPKPTLVLAALFAALCLAASAHATLQRVVVIRTDDVDAYVKELQKGQEILKNMGSVQVLRVWRPRFGGEAGTLTVAIEYPDLAAYAGDEKKLAASPEFQTWIKALAKQRKIVSDSLHDELKL